MDTNDPSSSLTSQGSEQSGTEQLFSSNERRSRRRETERKPGSAEVSKTDGTAYVDHDATSGIAVSDTVPERYAGEDYCWELWKAFMSDDRQNRKYLNLHNCTHESDEPQQLVDVVPLDGKNYLWQGPNDYEYVRFKSDGKDRFQHQNIGIISSYWGFPCRCKFLAWLKLDNNYLWGELQTIGNVLRAYEKNAPFHTTNHTRAILDVFTVYKTQFRDLIMALEACPEAEAIWVVDLPSPLQVEEAGFPERVCGSGSADYQRAKKYCIVLTAVMVWNIYWCARGHFSEDYVDIDAHATTFMPSMENINRALLLFKWARWLPQQSKGVNFWKLSSKPTGKEPRRITMYEAKDPTKMRCTQEQAIGELRNISWDYTMRLRSRGPETARRYNREWNEDIEDFTAREAYGELYW